MSWADQIRQEIHEISLAEASIDANIRRHFFEREMKLDDNENATIPVGWYSDVSKNIPKDSSNRSLTFHQKRSQQKQTPRNQNTTTFPIQHHQQPRNKRQVSKIPKNKFTKSKLIRNRSLQTKSDAENFYTVKEAWPRRKLVVKDTSSQKDKDVFSLEKNNEIVIESKCRDSIQNNRNSSTTYYSNQNTQNCSKRDRTHTLQTESMCLSKQNQQKHEESEIGDSNNTFKKENNYSNVYSSSCDMVCNQYNSEKNVSHHEWAIRTSPTTDLNLSENTNQTQQPHKVLEQINLEVVKSDVKKYGTSIENHHISDTKCAVQNEEPISKDDLHDDMNVTEEEMSQKSESDALKATSKEKPTDFTSVPSKKICTISQTDRNSTVSDSSYTPIDTTLGTSDDATDTQKHPCEQDVHKTVSNRNQSFRKSISHERNENEPINNFNCKIPRTIEVEISKTDTEERQLNETASNTTSNILETPNKLEFVEMEDCHQIDDIANGNVNLDNDNFISQSSFPTNIEITDCNNLESDSNSCQDIISKNNTSIMTQLDRQFNETKSMLEKTDKLLLSSSTVLNL